MSRPILCRLIVGTVGDHSFGIKERGNGVFCGC
jgi:hypothetical protein